MNMCKEDESDVRSKFKVLFEEIFVKCIRRLKVEFPNIDESVLEDCVSEAVIDIISCLSKPTAEQPDNLYAYVLVSSRRKLYRKFSQSNKKNIQLPEEFILEDEIGMDPESMALSLERRERQGGALSESFRSFVSYCERRGGDSLRVKECIERWFMGEENKETVNRMFEYSSYPKPNDQVSLDRGRGWERIIQYRNSNDVRGTLFDTTPKRKREKERIIPENPGENPPLSSEAEEDVSNILNKLPEAESSTFVHLWIVKDTKAYCPSSTRLDGFVEWYKQFKDHYREDCPVELIDIFYHAVERNCRFCSKLLN
jgi:DNA-directed RNA polymerase specialized sigma24 family protein